MNAPVFIAHDLGTRMGGRWSTEKVETLKTMWAAGASLREIATATGMDVEQVRAKRYSLDLPTRRKGMTVDDKWPEHKKQILRREWQLGTSLAHIAERVGKTEHQVKAQRAAMKLTPRRKDGSSVCLHFYCTKEEAARLSRRAMVKGVSRSGLVRRLVLRELQ